MTRIALAIATFYPELADRLEQSATKALQDAGVDVIDRFEVPGAFELPLLATWAAEARYDGVVMLGAVIRGETSHYDHVCTEVARGAMDVQLRTGVPCGLGVLTVENHEQALARSGGGKRDSGAHAAEAVLALLAARREI